VPDARPAPRAYGVVGRALLLAALLLFVTAMLFFAGLFPIPERTRLIIAGVLVFMAVLDAALGMFFLTRSQS
jgi:hypothetical protein